VVDSFWFAGRFVMSSSTSSPTIFCPGVFLASMRVHCMLMRQLIKLLFFHVFGAMERHYKLWRCMRPPVADFTLPRVRANLLWHEHRCMLIQSALCDVKKDGNCISPVFVFSNKHVQIGTGSLRIYPTSVCLGSRRKTARKMQSARSGNFLFFVEFSRKIHSMRYY
jgi:hypothetical protein